MSSRMNRGVVFGSEGSVAPYPTSTTSLPSMNVVNDYNTSVRAADPEELRKRAREIERKLDLSLDNISENDDINIAVTKVKDAYDFLRQLQDIIKQMNSSGMSAVQMQHHVEKQRQFAQQLQRFRTRLDDKRARAALFSPTQDPELGVSDDLSTNMKTLMQDRESLLNSNRSASEMIAQGFQVRETIARGCIALENNLARLQGTVVKFDSIDSVMNAIKRAKIKNTVTLAVVIGLCICFLVWYAIR